VAPGSRIVITVDIADIDPVGVGEVVVGVELTGAGGSSSSSVEECDERRGEVFGVKGLAG
jgi:hypothetical protein